MKSKAFVSCPPCGENAPTGAKGGFKNQENQFDNPPTRLRRTSPARGEGNSEKTYSLPAKRAKIHHRPRSKNMRNLARQLRKTQTPQERKLWWHLCRANLGVKFRRQYLIDDTYIADFICLEKKVIIEVDGSQHAQNSQDAKRTAYLEQQGFKIIRFWNNEVIKQISACLKAIHQACLQR